MAPLYKRYIPPSTTASTPAPRLKHPLPVAKPPEPEKPPKRKRERTDEEVAERKAKKLRKKGIDPATADLPATSTAQSKDPEERKTKKSKNKGTDPIPAEAQVAIPAPAKSAENGLPELQGDFAHIKNNKKRHKLEKEARKARKVAEKDGDATGLNGQVDNEHARGNQAISEGDQNVEYARMPDARTEGLEQSNVPAANETHDASLQPRKRRHKLESILKVPADTSKEPPVDDSDHLKKHDGVMSKFNKSAKLSQDAPRPVHTEEETGDKPAILDLAPLPQPEKVPTPEFIPDQSSLPSWLAKPEIISSEATATFADLNLEPKVTEHLSKLGFENALPVQQALIPRLLAPGTSGALFLPGSESVLPDFAVSAPTGSGKTLSYLLPIFESIKARAGLGQLKALVVVPTRELVVQVAAVAESLARGSSLKVGVATGTGSFKDEQAKLIKTGRKYHPEGYQELVAKADRQNHPPAESCEEFPQYLEELENQDERDQKRISDAVASLVDHTPTYISAIDILIATPGRLLEHLSSTLGFNLYHLEWLILDEADKLIGDQYDGFLSAINQGLEHPRPVVVQDARERYLRSKDCWDEKRERRVRKVVLSATMTRDVSKLVDLKLQWPRMIVVRGKDQDSGAEGAVGNNVDVVADTGDGFELPRNLTESCVPVGDGSEKPLYLIELLATRILSIFRDEAKASGESIKSLGPFDTVDSEEDSDANSDSDSSSVSSSSDESPQSSASSKNNDHKAQRDLRNENGRADAEMHPDRAALLDRQQVVQSALPPTVLIFTSSTESANRLSHLLKHIKPEWELWISTMTKSDPKRKRSSNAKTQEPSITISTDRAARGLDVLNDRTITHVIQYDVPRSATGYIHRVGRTARVSRYGEAWTLYTHSEARWFLNDVAKAKSIKRSGSVEKVKLSVDDDDDMRERLQGAVAAMRDEVHGRSK